MNDTTPLLHHPNSSSSFVSDITQIVKKEWMSFVGAEKSVLFVYLFVIAVYSLGFAFSAGADPAGLTWWVFFSVVVCSIFGNMLFISERIRGSIEILLTCGTSRAAILLGKVLFGLGMAFLFGAVSLGLALVWAGVANVESSITVNSWGPVLYLAASFMSTASAAWLSVQLPSPRLVHFMNMLILLAAVGLAFGTGIGPKGLAAILAALGVLFLALAWHAFHGEKVVRPVSL